MLGISSWLGALSMLLVSASLIYMMSVRLKTVLGFYQQEDYDSSRFWKAWFRIPVVDFRITIALVITVFVHALLGGAGMWTLWVFAGYVYWNTRREAAVNAAAKKKLVMTERAKRLYQLGAVLMAIAALTWLINLSFIWLWLQLTPLALMAANLALSPFQKRVNDRFVDDAKARLAAYPGKIIGITGSFGKTTTKHILGHSLDLLASVFYSPGSINTVLGHTRQIREKLHKDDEYFIAEMGAYGVGSIQRLCDFIGPSVGIITSIGNAHYERFKSLETVAEAKSELGFDALKHPEGRAYLHGSIMTYEPFQRMKREFGDRVVVCGAEEGSEFRLLSQSTGLEGVTITAEYKGATDTYVLPLLGEHNVGNLVLIIAFLRDEGFSAELIALVLKSMPQIQHRLERKEAGYTLLDDAYNSNPTGFKSALEALDALGKEKGGRRILVTPGMAELGEQHDAQHAQIAKVAAVTCDIVLPVRPDRIPTFVEELKGSEAEVIEVSSFDAARRWLAKNATAQDVVLLENDLPDLLETKRFL